MIVSDARLAAQLIAPGEEPRFFDEIGCLRQYLAGARGLPQGATTYVADHRSGTWVRASEAIYVLAPALETPMASHWIAFADPESRDADPATRGGKAASAADIFGPAGPPDGGEGAERATPGARDAP
jgi:copper chaperone NosL